jgi:glycosyltransferase involved in cell wall biosynthesis
LSRRALLICYYFPPLGLGGVTRPLNLFKLLPQYGYECDVLTVKPVLYRAYEPELLEGLDASRIHRSGSRDLQRTLYLLGIRRAGAHTFETGSRAISQAFPDSKAGWVKPAIRLGKRLLRDRKFDVIISTSPPISSHLVAMKLAAEFAVPWVADFRDFWHSFRAEEVLIDSGKIQKAKRLRATIKQKATAVTAVNQSIIDYVGTGEVITNGFSSELAMSWRPPSSSASFEIGLLGTFNDDLPIEPLLRVLVTPKSRQSDRLECSRIIQVGNVDRKWLQRQLHQYELLDRCVMHGLQPRDKTIPLLNETSMFYVGLNAQRETSILPGRIFDLMASGRPILAYAPPKSEIAQLVAETGSGFCFTDQTIEQAAAYVQDTTEKIKQNILKITPMPEYSRPYSWGNVVAKYSQLLDRVL